jgi:diguanylate cyclase (GGDEF)-like protein
MLTRGLAVWDKDGIANRIAGSQSDITDRKFAEEKLLHDAFYDGLTGLPNRALFLDRLKHAIERTKRHKEYRFGVLFLDLDRFKDVNDSLGHMLGDQLLIATSQLLQGGLRSTDTASRFGGDEFVILLEEISDLGAAVRVATWIQESLAAPFNLKEHEVYITTSIGIVIGSAVYQKPEDILRDADIAMYVAKSRGKARYEIFNAAMRERIMERLTLENDLRLAIERHEFEVYYQPIVSLQTGQLIGFEALSRWRHPERGLLPPAEFIPIAEETGMIMPIDRWVLRQACTQMRIWQENIPFFPSLTISVNMSGKQIAQPDLIEQIGQGLAESGLDAHCLKIEITESTIMENNVATADVFFRLKNMGVEVQIDDFGTGYSSLGYLHQFPVNALKIDRSFINLLDSASSNPEIAQTVVTLAHELGMAAVAEGVETESQLRQLRDLGCEFGQGFLLSVPLTSALVTEMLTEIHDGKNPFEVIKAKTGSLSQAALLSHTGALGLGG